MTSYNVIMDGVPPPEEDSPSKNRPIWALRMPFGSVAPAAPWRQPDIHPAQLPPNHDVLTLCCSLSPPWLPVRRSHFAAPHRPLLHPRLAPPRPRGRSPSPRRALPPLESLPAPPLAGGRGAVGRTPRWPAPSWPGGAAGGVRGSGDVRVVRPHGYAWRPALSRPSPLPSHPLSNHRRRHGFGRRLGRPTEKKCALFRVEHGGIVR